jgi:phosphomannomutase
MSFDHLKSIYRDFDIRGLYGVEITDDEVYKIAKALTLHFKIQKVAIGRDIRPSADAMFSALSRGFIESGVNVVDLGLCTTPMSYFICGSTDVEMTVMITASHMPAEYNGMKITIEDAKPVTGDVLKIIRDIVGTHTFSEETIHGTMSSHALQADWINTFKAKHNLRGSNLSVVIDPANMIGALEVATFKAFEPDITVHSIFDEFDHTCPNHEANPVKYETLAALAEKVVCENANLGIAFDGDADRVGFVDETGAPVPGDIIATIIAPYILQKFPGAPIICDIRSTRSLREEIENNGGTALFSKVGHTHVRSLMRKHDSPYGAELSGHYFFKESYFSEGGPLPAFIIMEIMHATGKKLSELAMAVKRYYHSGEVNSHITRSVDDIYAELSDKYKSISIEQNRLDGLSLVTEDWWCNIRPSANDPVMRLNLEAKTPQIMEKMRDEILEVIRRA